MPALWPWRAILFLLIVSQGLCFASWINGSHNDNLHSETPCHTRQFTSDASESGAEQASWRALHPKKRVLFQTVESISASQFTIGAMKRTRQAQQMGHCQLCHRTWRCPNCINYFNTLTAGIFRINIVQSYPALTNKLKAPGGIDVFFPDLGSTTHNNALVIIQDPPVFLIFLYRVNSHACFLRGFNAGLLQAVVD